MTTAIAIRAIGLRKAYRLYQHPLDALIEAIVKKPRHVESVALENVDLELRRGEIVAVLGRNGAGKSTLLKLIAGTLERTSGELEVNGRITAILELGTGFHPDYTGRENIYMGGMCLGMSRREIDAKLDSIIDFSELRDVIDQPFKTYSTGMQARLTFSTAISVEPDILIVDEALSVGDARFQLKCFTWIQGLRQKNATILLVSHDVNTITSICDRGLILEKGHVYFQGSASEATVCYQKLLFGDKPLAKTLVGQEQSNDFIEPGLPRSSSPSESGPSVNDAQRYGSGIVELLDWGILDQDGSRVSVIKANDTCMLFMSFKSDANVDDLVAGFAIKDRRGTALWGLNNLTVDSCPRVVKRGELIDVKVKCAMNLAAGAYFVTLGVAHQNGDKIDFMENAIEFSVYGTSHLFTLSQVSMSEVFTISSREPAIADTIANFNSDSIVNSQ